MCLIGRYYRVRITAADPESVLSKLTNENIEVLNVECRDLLTVEFILRKNQYVTAVSVLEKEGSSYRIVKNEGALWILSSFARRSFLLVGVVLFLLLAFVLPRYVFFVEVSGNERVAKRTILQQAEKCGIYFGARAADVRSETVKNHLLQQLPELQWVGVTTSGTVATIQVRERSIPHKETESKTTVSSVVAAHDGVITQMNVYRGTPLVTVGQGVKIGDILISGYTDCGLKTIAQQATGEIFAHTLRKISVVSPAPTIRRGGIIEKDTSYRLRIGKKVINLWNHSGIHDATCVKMYLEDYWTLPGGFRLPVSVIKETILHCDNGSAVDGAEKCDWLIQYARQHLLSQMIAGEVLDESLIWNMSEDFCELSGNYACHEMIGQVKREESIE